MEEMFRRTQVSFHDGRQVPKNLLEDDWYPVMVKAWAEYAECWVAFKRIMANKPKRFKRRRGLKVTIRVGGMGWGGRPNHYPAEITLPGPYRNQLAGPMTERDIKRLVQRWFGDQLTRMDIDAVQVIVRRGWRESVPMEQVNLDAFWDGTGLARQVHSMVTGRLNRINTHPLPWATDAPEDVRRGRIPDHGHGPGVVNPPVEGPPKVVPKPTKPKVDKPVPRRGGRGQPVRVRKPGRG